MRDTLSRPSGVTGMERDDMTTQTTTQTAAIARAATSTTGIVAAMAAGLLLLFCRATRKPRSCMTRPTTSATPWPFPATEQRLTTCP